MTTSMFIWSLQLFFFQSVETCLNNRTALCVQEQHIMSEHHPSRSAVQIGGSSAQFAVFSGGEEFNFNSVFDSSRTDLFSGSLPRESECQKSFAPLRHMLVSHDRELILKNTHFLFFAATYCFCHVSLQLDRKHTVALLPSSPSPVWLTLHQLARPWESEEGALLRMLEVNARQTVTSRARRQRHGWKGD